MAGVENVGVLFAGSFDETKMENVCSAEQQPVLTFLFFIFGLETGAECPEYEKNQEGCWQSILKLGLND